MRDEYTLMIAAITLSEELNFSRAAKRLHIRQPTLSKQIDQLEKRVGYRLFDREGRHGVRINDYGRGFLEEARLSLLHCNRAFQAPRLIGQGAEAVINVGRSPYTDPFLTTTLLSTHLPLYPRLRIELSSRYSVDLANELLDGAIDLAIATEPPGSPHLTMTKVAEHPFYIGMSKQDELACHRSVTLDQLEGRRWIIFERRLHPPVYDAVMHLAELRRVVPAKVQHVTAPEEAFPFLADGSSVAFLVKAGALLLARNGVTVRPLAESALSLKTFLASRADNVSRLASEVVRAFMTKLSIMMKDRQTALSH